MAQPEEAKRGRAAPAAPAVEREWEELIEQHPGAWTAYQRIMPLGRGALVRLREHLARHHDPHGLADAAAPIAREFRRNGPRSDEG